MFQDLTSLVFDIGTSTTKVGYGGDDAPKLITNSYVARNNSMDIQGAQKYIIGDKYLNIQREQKEIQSIFKRKDAQACQIDFQKYQPFVQHLLKEQLQVDVSSYSILLSQDVSYKPHELRKHRQKISQFLFQRIGVPNIYFLKNPVLSCFATGRSTALVCDSGDSYTRVVAVHDGYCLYKAARSIPYAGSSLTNNLKAVLQKKLGSQIPTRFSQRISPSFRDFHIRQVLQDIKQSFTSRQTQDGLEDVTTIQYELPDHNSIALTKSQIPQNLLNTSLQTLKNGLIYRNLPQLISDTINLCDIDIKKQLYSNILLTGGNMLYSNTMSQVLSKVGEIAPPNAKVKGVQMVANQERVYAGWIGGSIVTSLSSFQSYWVGKEEWKEQGINIVQKKCN